MKLENLNIKEMIIDIDETLNAFKVNRSDFIDYLKSRKKERFLIFKSYEEKRNDIASKEINELRRKVDLMISRIKKGDKNLKIKSLEERFLNQKNTILSNLEKELEIYKEKIEVLNTKLEEFKNSDTYIGYLLFKEENENEIAFAFPIKIENENGNIYIRNELNKEILSNKKIFNNMKYEKIKPDEVIRNLKNIECEVIEKMKLIKIDIKSKSILEDLLESKELSNRMKKIINQEEYSSLAKFKQQGAVLKTNNKEVLQIVTQKNDFLLLGNKYKEKFLEIIENLLLEEEKILIVAEDENSMEQNIKQYMFINHTDEKINKLTNYEILENIKASNSSIKKIMKVEDIMSMTTDFGLDVKQMCNKFKDYNLYSNDEHIRYSKNLNLDNITYRELKRNIEDISSEDVEKYKTYKAYKDKFITFNEYPYSYEELLNIKNVIQKIESVAVKKCEENRKYFKKIGFKIKNKGSRLEIEELREIGREIAREKNRELLIEDKSTWSIKNIFSGTKHKEKRRDELEFFKEREVEEIKNVIEFYKSLDVNYKNLEEIDKTLFKDIISILCKDNYSEEICKKLKNIEFSLKNKDILSVINSWSNLKIALIDYVYKSKSIKESKESLIIFKISDELFKISKEYEVNIVKEFNNYKKSNLTDLIENRNKLFSEYIKRKCNRDQGLQICSFKELESLKLKHEMYNTIVMVNYEVRDEDEILPLIYRGERCLSFRDNGSNNKYEMNFIKLQ